MSKIGLILEREYISRVKKKSFIIMTLLSPVLFAALIILPSWFAMSGSSDLKKVAVIDQTGLFSESLKNTSTLEFDFIQASPEEYKKELKSGAHSSLLVIAPAEDSLQNPVIKLYAYDQPGIDVVNAISSGLENDIESRKLKSYNIPDIDKILASVKTNIEVQTIKMSESGEEKESSTTLAMIISYVCGLMLYMFIFMFGVQVMRGVMEEKTNRIVEVVISSVKPFELMMGKVLGVALVGLTQCLMWAVLTLVLVSAGKMFFFGILDVENLQAVSVAGGAAVDQGTMEAARMFGMIKMLNLPMLAGTFLFYFLGGYLLYAALFAAVGSAVDNESDSQQFMMPITIPLIVAIVVLSSVFRDPSGPVAFWFSMIPFTSPIIMMARIPFGVPLHELFISMFILVVFFIGAIWMAAKIYRTGILMYGKKPGWAELWKWIRYKD
ncbi:MAG: ABC transporter permease [Bacteroidales bacterium]|nr:ABC transporter permease [Bacteroidales bacterium]